MSSAVRSDDDGIRSTVRRRGAPREEGRHCVIELRRLRVDSTPLAPLPFIASAARVRAVEGGESMSSFTDLIHYLRARFQVEEGQTMAEYGVVLAVLALGVVVALGLLSGAISGAIDRVRGIL
jgi:Flp pilus assembly pilin Flp